MHKIGIQAVGTIKQPDIEMGYRLIKEAGFDCVDFNFDEYLNCNDTNAGIVNDIFDRPMEEMWVDFEKHVKMAQKYGLTFEQMHAPFPTLQWGKEEINKKTLRIANNCIELCARMGGHYIVIHPVTLAYEHSKQEEHDFNIKMYKGLIATAKRTHQIICLENMFEQQGYHLVEGICSDFTEAAAMIDELNETAGEEIFGFCYDVGHANILGKNLYQSVLTLGDRLKVLHIHDNDGVSDLHTMPYTFARSWGGLSTDWEGFLKGLKEINYQGVINFETCRLMQGLPEELHPAALRLQADMGKYFSKKIEAMQ